MCCTQPQSAELAGGATTVYSPGDYDPGGAIRLRDRIDRGEAAGPHVLTAGPYFTSGEAASWMPSASTVTDTLTQYAAWHNRVDGIKVYTGISEDQLAALVRAAGRDGLPVTGHLESVSAARATELGITGLEHGIFSMSEFWPPGASFEGQYCALAELRVDSPAVNALIEALVERRVAIGNTLLVFKDGIPYDPAVLRESVEGVIGRP
ncbi:MAG: hypothetical protein ACRDH2_02625 [Anaerolineales bacterium]